MNHKTLRLKQSSDILLARQACREMAQNLGFGTADQCRLATAISELARNAIQYAGEGICTIADTSKNGSVVISVVVEDHGPGIDDVEQALEPGFTTSGGLGAGLPGAKRLVHEFNLNSKPGLTIVQIKMMRKTG